MSQKTAVAPRWWTTLAVETHVNAGTTTSSPGPAPSAASAACSAVVPELVATAWAAPVKVATLASNSATAGPWATQPDSSVRATAASSSSPKSGFVIGITTASVRRLLPSSFTPTLVDLAEHSPEPMNCADALAVSVVIPAYRSGGSLLRCVESLDADGKRVEAIVVDNGDDADTVAAAERMPGVVVVRPGENLGYAGGCNAGAAQARGEVLVFVNQDVTASPEALGALGDVARDPAVGVAMARVLLLDDPGKLNSSGTVVHVSGLAWAGGHGQPAETFAELRDVGAPSGAALAIRRALFRELGGFTEELFMYQEDLELGWRARLTGLRVVATPAADVLHDYEFGRNAQKQYLLERNRLVFVLSAYPARLLLIAAPVLAAAELGLFVLSLAQGWAGEKVRGWAWCARRTRWLVRHRRETQRLRRVPVAEVARYLTPVIDPAVMTAPGIVKFANPLMSGYWSVARRVL